MADAVNGVVAVAVETPQHTGLGAPLDYSADALPPGTLVRVPLGRRDVPGIVWDRPAEAEAPPELRPVREVLAAMPPLGASWRQLVAFAAAYYQRGLGELALAVLPPELRKLDDVQLARRVARLRKPAVPARAARRAGLAAATAAAEAADAQHGVQPAADTPEAAPAFPPAEAGPPAAAEAPPLNDEQQAAVDAIGAAAGTYLLHGVTGSGKTEVYLHAAEAALAAGRQVLVMVPEINLTPQLEARLAQRFAGRRLVALHSALTPAQRLKHWLLAHLGEADLVLGTRLAVFASLPRLGLIVADEEHDPSFKQQEGARYSARDLAVYRGHLEGVPVVLGSATPSLETWQRVQEGRYTRLALSQRIGGGVLPRVRLFDMNTLPRQRGSAAPALAPALVDAVAERIERGEQSLLFLNRRGYAPVLHCTACGWKSGCPHCSAWRVFHKGDRSLRCHHCGFSERVPRACPDCGNLDIAPLGRGTERLEEQIAQLLPGARVARIDADTTRLKGSLEAQLGAVHAGDVDVLVGTQMIAKGHDFRRITLVAAVNPDSALFASDFRAPERLFALLMQAAGRAGRDAQQAARSEMWVQSWHPQHALYAALRKHDYEAFAASQLEERQSAGLPPFSSLALLRAEAREASIAQGFLRAASELAQAMADEAGVTLYPPVPPPVARVADVDRLQMLVESPSRVALQRLLAAWLPQLHALRSVHKGVLRWAVDVDPLAI
ncbi:primosomal protein N' [Aquincola tertiaricarbonis]|uniref:Replication restart protein PriA n=1 Tax=Aquincola tertiaricarbonis TaxID=391953 RepID=A0ABY4S9B7_AQUTE|nr:primosomal protein N' [Aquincola tertiaricarbonis]URI09953.1 primosomal protein N' [Aquincola tertiaricarbonis]